MYLFFLLKTGGSLAKATSVSHSVKTECCCEALSVSGKAASVCSAHFGSGVVRDESDRIWSGYCTLWRLDFSCGRPPWLSRMKGSKRLTP